MRATRVQCLTRLIGWHPCLKYGASLQSFASDVYSLGMCIVEAMRVVEGAEHCLPWGDLDNTAVRVNARMGYLPLRPQRCTDNQWELVMRMCAHDPTRRIKISTVVDELKKLTCENEDGSTATAATAPEAIAAIIAEMKNTCSQHEGSPVSLIYELFWDRLEHVSTLLVNQELLELVASAETTTRALAVITNKLIEFTELAIRGYALHRRLDKLIEANFLSFDSDDSKVHDWKPMCEEFMRVMEKKRSSEVTDATTLGDESAVI